MKVVFFTLLFVSLVGCSSPPRVYKTGLSKHPHVLTLKPTGSYELEHLFMEQAIETGQWATVRKDSVMEAVLLQPDCPDQKKQYAYLVDPKHNTISLWLHDDMRTLWITHIPGPGSPHTVIGLNQYER